MESSRDSTLCKYPEEFKAEIQGDVRGAAFVAAFLTVAEGGGSQGSVHGRLEAQGGSVQTVAVIQRQTGGPES